MRTTRRTVLRKGLGYVLAGCSSGSGETAPPTGLPDRLYALTGSYEIPAGSFRDLAFDIDSPAVIDYTADVRSGPNLDVFLLARDEFRAYERGSAFEPVDDASALDTSYADTRVDL